MSIVKNAIRCGICHSMADRYPEDFVCQANNGHRADRTIGLWTDFTEDDTPDQSKDIGERIIAREKE